MFDQLSFSKQVAENIKVGKDITRVTARSPSKAEVLYSITNGDPVNQFNVDFKTGTLLKPWSYFRRPSGRLVYYY